MLFISYYTPCLEMKMQYLSKPLELSPQSKYFSDNKIKEVKSIKVMKFQADPKTEKVIKYCWSIKILLWSLMIIFISVMNLLLGKVKTHYQPSKEYFKSNDDKKANKAIE